MILWKLLRGYAALKVVLVALYEHVLQLGVPASVGLSLSAMVPKLAGMERQLSKIVCQ